MAGFNGNDPCGGIPFKFNAAIDLGWRSVEAGRQHGTESRGVLLRAQLKLGYGDVICSADGWQVPFESGLGEQDVDRVGVGWPNPARQIIQWPVWWLRMVVGWFGFRCWQPMALTAGILAQRNRKALQVNARG